MATFVRLLSIPLADGSREHVFTYPKAQLDEVDSRSSVTDDAVRVMQRGMVRYAARDKDWSWATTFLPSESSIPAAVSLHQRGVVVVDDVLNPDDYLAFEDGAPFYNKGFNGIVVTADDAAQIPSMTGSGFVSLADDRYPGCGAWRLTGTGFAQLTDTASSLNSPGHAVMYLLGTPGGTALNYLAPATVSRLDLSLAKGVGIVNIACMCAARESVAGVSSSLVSVDLSGLATAQVETAAGCFSGCTYLRSVDTQSLNVSHATDLSEMFKGCLSLEVLDLDTWKTPLCTTFASMFDGCTRLRSLYASQLSFAACSSMARMFHGCSAVMYARIGGIGSSESLQSYDFSQLKKWGFMSDLEVSQDLSEPNYAALVDSLLTLSANRAGAGKDPVTILLAGPVFSSISQATKAAIAARGYNLATA